jgi:lysophospholipase L1-like esterase
MAATNFPLKTALALATAVAALAAARHLDATKGLSPAIFAEAAHVQFFRHAPSAYPPTIAAAPPARPIGTQADGTLCPILPGVSPKTSHRPVSPYLIDDCGTLDPFFAALHSLEMPTKPGDPETVTVLHYGDSPTTADLITGDVRELLQSRFGDAGRGFLLAAKPWAWYGHRGVDLSDKDWTTSTAVGKGREEVYGLGGASFEGTPGASTQITLKNPNQTTIEIAFLARPNGGDLAVSANDTTVETFSTAADAPHPAWHTVALPPGSRSIDLKPTSGSVRLFGETLRTGHRGVLYDSLGLNGASTSVLSNGFNNAAWADALQHTKPALVIINYGTNESGFGAYVDKQYEPTLRTAIARIRAALPGVPILVMSPMDRGQRSGVDEIKTYDTIPRIVAIQRRVAAEQNCAFFDTFNSMGGDGTMSRWYTGHPRLVAGDLIHPTPQGAALVANLFVKDLALDYDRFLGHSTPPPTQNLASKPATQPATPHVAPIQQTPAKPTPPPLAVLPKPKPSAAGDPVPVTPEAAKPDASTQPVPAEPNPPSPKPEQPPL